MLIFCPKNIKSQQLQKLPDDDQTKFTDIGEIRLLITNLGKFGSSFSQWPSIPSCEYPANSWIEHLFIGGLWVGCNKSDDSIGTNSIGPFVTVGAYDENVLGGNGEFTTKIGDTIVQRSSLVNSNYYSPSAISHQDFVMNYSDTSLYRFNGEPIYDHTPIGISINQESYCWNFNYANAFVILNHWVKNISNKYLTNIYIGIWSDAVLGKGRPVGSSALIRVVMHS